MFLANKNIYAQVESPEKSAQKATQFYSKLLTLTKTQEDSINKVFLEMYTSQYEAKKAVNKAGELSQNKDSNIKKVLTAEQIDKYQSYLKHVSDSITNSKLPPWKRK